MAARRVPPCPPPPRSPTSQGPAALDLEKTPSHPKVALQQPSHKKASLKSTKLFRHFRSVFRSFPIISPACKIPVLLHNSRLNDVHIHGGTRMTGTLFGHRKGRVSLAIQESPRCFPIFLLELAIPTSKLLQELGLGLVRIALECEKRPEEKIKLMDEPIWNLYCNGRKMGYAVKREANAEDLNVMQMLHAVSMGAGVLPSEAIDLPDGELTYMRAHFQRVIGSKDSETYYMMNPDSNTGPELSIFFVRI